MHDATHPRRPVDMTGIDDTDQHPTDGDMGVSSERVGRTGPGQTDTTGTRDDSQVEPADADLPPEQSVGGVEINPDAPVPPVSGYSSQDPRSADHPFDEGS